MKTKKFQRGQALVFYAFMLPIIFLFAGVGLDFGWYYLNVSRLQNAADAAALAGAHALVENGEAFKNYYPVRLASNKLPWNFEQSYENVLDPTQGGFIYRLNYESRDDIKNAFMASRLSAETYTRKNLSDPQADLGESSDQTGNDWDPSITAINATDGWSLSADEPDKKVTGNIELRYKTMDARNDEPDVLYYLVHLQENIRHLFLPGWFDDMSAPVTAVVFLRPRDMHLNKAMTKLKNENTITNWEEQNRSKNSGLEGIYTGKWNHYMAGDSGSKDAVWYTSGDVYRTESVRVSTKEEGKGGGQKTKANDPTPNGNGKFYDKTEVDALNIDFQAEFGAQFTSDWDLGFAFPKSYYYSQNTKAGKTWDKGFGDDKRILFNAEFNESFPTRDKTKEADPLWVGIESDPIIKQTNATGGTVSVYNSVRQITLNFNQDNTAVKVNDKGNKYYEFRPYVVFYTGPEHIDYKEDENGVWIRHSQPVIVNLNADLNAILYFPNSPVIINGNGHKFKGFVIAKCFLKSVTEDDMANLNNKSKFILYDGFNKPVGFRGNFKTYTDGNGNTIYVRDENLLNEIPLPREYGDQGYIRENAYIQVDEKDTNRILVYDKATAKNHILLKYTKADSITYEVKEDDKHNESKTFANYINSTYKETFKRFSGLDDSQITAVNFPDENYNETTATYYVANVDLFDIDLDPDASPTVKKYVKVLAGDKVKFVDKNNLPYVKVRTNKEYFYVCVYDLKLAWSGSSGFNVSTNAGVRMIDNSFTDEEINSSYGTVSAKGIKTSTNEYKNVASNASASDADIYINPYDYWCDSWGIEGYNISPSLFNTYKNNWKKISWNLVKIIKSNPL